MNTRQIANKTQFSIEKVRLRLKKHKLYKGRNGQYSLKDFLTIVRSERMSTEFSKKGVIDADLLNPVEYYLTQKDNRLDVVCKIYSVKHYDLSKALHRLFKDGCLIVHSKMNYEN